MVKNLPSNAGDVGSIPSRGTKIPRAVGQLSPRATTTELTRLQERAHAPWSPCAKLERENPHATAREKPTQHNDELACLKK